jgi:hypothetical protein
VIKWLVFLMGDGFVTGLHTGLEVPRHDEKEKDAAVSCASCIYGILVSVLAALPAVAGFCPECESNCLSSVSAKEGTRTLTYLTSMRSLAGIAISLIHSLNMESG